MSEAGRPLRVQLVHQSFGDYVSGLATGLATPGLDIDLDVTSVASGSARLSGLSVPTSVPHTQVQLPRFRDPRSLVRGVSVVRDLMNQSADLIHWQAAGNPWLDLAFSFVMSRRPTVVTVHDMQAHPGDRSVLPGTFAAINRLVRRADQITVHAPHVREQVIAAGVDGSRVSVVAHGELATRYLTSQELPLPPEPDPTVLFFGRAQGYKGLDLLVAAMQALNASEPVARLIVAGSGPSLDELFPDGRNVPEWCEIHRGHVPLEAVPELFGMASLIALPYREASQSGVAALAAGFGRPVVATSVPGLVDIVEHEVTGLLVEPDDPRALAAAIERVIGDDRLRQTLRKGAYEASISRLSWPSIAAELSEVYRNAVTSHTSS